MKKKQINALLPYYGCNRLLAENVGAEIAGARWVGIPFAGGMPEIAFIDAPSIVVSDCHRLVINLARVAADPDTGPRLQRRLRSLLFHPDELRAAQEELRRLPLQFPAIPDPFPTAVSYFVSAWMNRSAVAGTKNEFSGSLPVRMTSSGGDSNTRYRSAIKALANFRRIASRCNFVVWDAFEFLQNVKDQADHAIYLDPPFPGAGGQYKFSFSFADHERLAAALERFAATRVVCRFHDHPLIRKLYGGPRWKWFHDTGRTQANTEAAEVLIINGDSRRQ